MIKKLVNLQLKFSIFIISLFFFISGFFLFFAMDLSQDPSFSALVSPNSVYNTNDRIIANTFGNKEAFIIFFKSDENTKLLDRPLLMNDEKVLERIDDMKKVLLESKYVVSVNGPFISPDSNYAQLIIEVASPRNIESFKLVISDIDYYMAEIGVISGVKTTLTGFPLLINRINTLLIEDNLKTIVFTIIAIFLVLFWYFRNFILSLIALSIPLISLIILAGIMSILNIPITITLAAVGILVLSIGVSFTIHIIMSYEKYLEEGLKPKDAIINAMEHLHIAIIASFITTLAGFTSLMFGLSPSSQSQGLVLSLAITIIFLLSFLLLPVLLNVFARNHKASKDKIFEGIKRNLAKLAQYQAKFPKTVISIVFLISLVMIFGASKVQFDTSNENWIPANDEIQNSFRESSLAFGNDFSSIKVLLNSQRSDLREIEVIRSIQSLTQILESHPYIERVDSPFSQLSLDKAQILTQFANDTLLSSKFNSDYTYSSFNIYVTSFETQSSGSSEILEEIKTILYENPIPDTEISLFGDTIRFSELGESLGKDTGLTTMISFILVFLIATFTYFSLRVGFIAILPIIISIVWTVGFMGFFNVPFTALSTGLIALVLGIGIDFSIHLVNSSYNYLKRGLNINDALEKTLTYSGGALLLTTITTFIGFISLVLATLLGIQRLGLSLAFSILSVFLVSIILVPAIISLGNRNKGNKKIKKNYKNKKNSDK